MLGAFDAALAHVAILDHEGTIVAVNGAWRAFAARNVSGPAPSSIEAATGVGANYLAACVGDESARRAAAGLRDVLARRTLRFDLEYPCVIEGERCWFAMSATPIDEPRGGAIVTHTDISAQKHAHQWTLGHNRVLESIAHGEPLPAVLAAVTRLVEDLQPGTLCSILLLEGDTLRLGAGPSLPAAYNAALSRVTIGPEVGSCGTAAFTRRLVVVDDIETDPLWKNFRWAFTDYGLRSCWSLPILAAGGGPVLGTFAIYARRALRPSQGVLQLLGGAAHLAGLAIERELASAELRASEERFRLLVLGVRDYGLFMTTPDGRVVTWSPGAERLYGYSEQEAATLNVRALEAVDAPPHRAASGSDRGEAEGWQVRKSGERFWASLATTPVYNDDGTLRGFARVVGDLTERLRLEEELLQAQKLEAVGRLAGGIAHDFNNLLTVIRGNVEFLSMDAQRVGPAWESLNEIRDAAERAAHLTRELLTFSRARAPQVSLTSVNEVVALSERVFVRLLGEDIRLTTALADELPPVRVDASQLEQVLLNLMMNARDAMPAGGVVTIETACARLTDDGGGGRSSLPPGLYVDLCVRDTGTGIDEATQARVFEPFFTTKLLGAGTGLGLAMVYGAVKQAGGTVRLESRLGFGTTFRVRLPAAGVSPMASRTDASTLAAPGGETVWLVVGDPAVRRTFGAALESHGYSVIEASADDLVQRVAEGGAAADVLITDEQVLPIDEQVAILRSSRPNVRVLHVVSHLDDDGHGAVHADVLLRKPATPLVLLAKVRAVLDPGADGPRALRGSS